MQQQQQQRADGIATATPTMRARPLANINNITNITPSEHPPSRLNQAQGPAPANLPPLRKLMSTPITDLHPDDDSDHVLPVIFAILDRGGNRAMSVKELGEAAFNQSLMRTSPSAAAQAIGTHIRNHMIRHRLYLENALFRSYRLEGGSEDVRVASALFCTSPASCRRGTTVWYLSPKAGKLDPFERLGVVLKQEDYTALAPQKRKIPPDDLPELQRPNKIRITLRLPPRTPIPRRSRPIVPTSGRIAPDTSDESSDDDDDSRSRTTSETDEDDEDMLDDFNSLLADDVPIAIPCARSADSFGPSQPFFDTCEPPPDSEDEDDDFHNSMLRPPAVDHNDAVFLFKQEDLLDFDLKEEDLAAIVLNELGSPEPSTSTLNVKLEEGIQSLTAHPDLEWTALQTEDGMFSPMELLGTDSPDSVDIDDIASAGVSSPAAYPDANRTLSVPSPTPWIKTEEDPILFSDIKSTDLHTVDDDFAPVQSPVSAIPIPSCIARPWETADWVPIPGPESVSTDDVERACGDKAMSKKSIAASTSAPTQRRARRPRLSIGGLTAFNHASGPASARAGHLRRHSHAAGVMPNRRLSIISTAFSDWTSGTPDDPEAPLVTPSHTGWRMQWPLANGSSSTLAYEKIEENAVEDESSVPEEEKKPSSITEEESETNGKELARLLASPSFNQVISKGLPPNHRIATMILLGIPIFQCHVENPPLNLYRRMDTDYVNISSLLTYAKHLAQATPNRSRNPAVPAASARSQPTNSTVDELPPNHVFINSGARDIHGGWVPLSTAKSVAKNYHDLPTFVRRMFLSDNLADKFPSPIPTVKQMLIAAREKEKGTAPPFGKSFAKPSSLSAHDLLVPSGSVITTPTLTPAPISPIARGSAHVINGGAYPLSPVAVLSNANALAGKTPTMSAQSLLSLLSQTKAWAVKTPLEPEPLKPEEEAMFKALVKSPPRPKANGKAGDKDSDEEEAGGEDMSVDEQEEEAVREVIDLVSDEEDEVPPKRNLRSLGKKTEETLPARRSMRHVRTISSSSSELTVSESESSAPPPSLDSRPALKGKSTNLPKVLTPVQATRTRRGSEALVKIIKVDEPAPLGKPRRSGRVSKGDKQNTPTTAATPLTPSTPVAATSAKSKASSASTVTNGKPKRSGEKDKEPDTDAPITTRAGALKNQKRVLRSRP